MIDANWNGTVNPIKRAAVEECKVRVLAVNNIMLPVLDGIEGWSYKPVHKVRLLGVVHATIA